MHPSSSIINSSLLAPGLVLALAHASSVKVSILPQDSKKKRRILNLHQAYYIRVGLVVESLISDPRRWARPRKQEREGEEKRVRQAQSGLDSAWKAQPSTLRDWSNEPQVRGLRLKNQARKKDELSRQQTGAAQTSTGWYLIRTLSQPSHRHGGSDYARPPEGEWPGQTQAESVGRPERWTG